MSAQYSRRQIAALVLNASLVTLPAFLLSTPRFQPVAERFGGRGPEVSHTFALSQPESLYLDYELVLTADGQQRPDVVVRLNGTPVATLKIEALSKQEFGKTRLAAAASRPGANTIVVGVEGRADGAIELRARVHNYFGIAPDVPRAVIVSDEAVRLWWAGRPLAGHAIAFLLILALATAALWLLSRTSRNRAMAIVPGAPSALLLPVLIWALVMDRHVWLFPETLLALVAVPWLLVLAGRGLTRRRGVLLAKLAGTVAATLLLLELALRATNAISPSYIFYSDSFGRYRGRPGAPHHGTVLNSRGFNDAEHAVSRPPHVTTRIVALGDSFAFGVVPYAANYLTLLEQEASSDGSVEVVNMGVSATDPRDYRAIFVEEGLAYQPDLVLVSMYLGNDLDARRPRWYERSYVTTLINFVWHLSRARQTVVLAEGADAPYRDDEPSLDEGSFLRILMERAALYTSPDDALTEQVDRAVGEIADICALARGAGAGCLVVLIPDETQVDPALQAEVARGWGRPVDSIDFTRPTRLVAASLDRAGVRTLDLLPAFRAGARATRLYKPRDTHWNVAGNRLAASEILTVVRAWARDRSRTSTAPP